MATKILSKRVQISKDIATQVAAITVASFFTVFSLIACKALLQQRSYQAKVISGKETAKKQLNENIAAVSSLVSKYKEFEGRSENILKGDPNGTADNDGDNAKLVLDALPSKYDFPAVTSSLEKLLTGYQIDTIIGVDDELAQAKVDTTSSQSSSSSSANKSTTTTKKKVVVDAKKPIVMPFELAYTVPVTGYQQGIDFILKLEKSIRPFQVTQLTITAHEKDLQFGVTANTYYLPTKTLTITKKVVK